VTSTAAHHIGPGRAMRVLRAIGRWTLPALLVLAAGSCGRTLTPNETAFAALVHGPTLDTTTIRFGDRMAPEPLRTVPVRPPVACRDRLYPRPKGPTFRSTSAALTAFQTVHFRDRWYRDDFLAGWPDALPLDDALLFAHELVHVWQWQNRAITGYHPLRAAFEHVGSPDPYQFDTEIAAPFFAYGYEQQAAIMEEFICCAALAPRAARTTRLRAILAPYFALPPAGEPLATEIILPWQGTEVDGICD
jgi:hypothetical protein